MLDKLDLITSLMFDKSLLIASVVGYTRLDHHVPLIVLQVITKNTVWIHQMLFVQSYLGDPSDLISDGMLDAHH